MLNDCVDASADAAIAGADNNPQQTNTAKTHRFVEIVKIADSPYPVVQDFRARSALGQNNAIAALLDVNRKAAL